MAGKQTVLFSIRDELEIICQSESTPTDQNMDYPELTVYSKFKKFKFFLHINTQKIL